MCTPTQGVWQPAGCVSCELVCVCVSFVRVVIICLASTHTALVSSPSLAVLHLSTYLPTDSSDFQCLCMEHHAPTHPHIPLCLRLPSPPPTPTPTNAALLGDPRAYAGAMRSIGQLSYPFALKTGRIGIAAAPFVLWAAARCPSEIESRCGRDLLRALHRPSSRTGACLWLHQLDDGVSACRSHHPSLPSQPIDGL